VAVTVQQAPFVVLDEDYRIVEVGPLAQATFGPLLGRNVHECFPDAASLYRPYYENARATGEVVEFAQYYDGYVMLIKAEPLENGRLAVTWEILGMLDTMNLDALRLSLGRILAKLEEREKRVRVQRGRESLRLIEGGA
jgi:PAS fold